jgi:hypothetical protein
MSTLIQMLVLTTAAAGGILYLLFQDIAWVCSAIC